MVTTKILDDRLLLLESYEIRRRNESLWRMTQERLKARVNQPITTGDMVLSDDNFLNLIVDEWNSWLLIVPLLQHPSGYCISLPYLFGWGSLVARLDVARYKRREDVSVTRVDVMLDHQVDIIKAFMRAMR